jgi:hypothetical protein
MGAKMIRRFREVLRDVGFCLHSLSQSQAQWEIEMGRTIFARRKKLLLAAVAPIILALVWSWALGEPTPAASAPLPGQFVSALSDDPLPQEIPTLGGSKAFMPSQVTPEMFFGSILVGLIAGLITGVIGAGGGYILTPALMSFGVRGIMCVGTDQFHLFAKAIMGTTIHRKLGNVNLRLAVWFVAGSFFGVTLGGLLSRYIFCYSPALSDAVISLSYVLVLGILGLYAIMDWLRLRKTPLSKSATEATTSFAKRLQRLPFRPRVRFDTAIVHGGRSICIYPVIVCGFIVGFVASIMGVGGGFLTFPMFVYGLGVSTFTTVGTDILQIIFTTAYSSIFQYAIYGFVFYTVAIGMLVGSLVGVQVGALVTNVVKGSQIRAFFALTILAGFFNRFFALPRKLADLGYVSMSREASVRIEHAGVVLFFGIVGIFALWILGVFVRNVGVMRAHRSGFPVPAGGPLIVDRTKFRLGLAGLIVFAIVLCVGVTLSRNGQTALTWADTFFNQLAKDSAYCIPKARKEAAAFADVPIDVDIQAREPLDAAEMHRVITASGCRASQTADRRTRILGTMGQLSAAAIADAELAFHNDGEALQAKYEMHANDPLYCWWLVFDGLARRYVQENRSDLADFARCIAAKVLEPAYNFRGIEARNTRDNVLPMAGLLGFYILYTLWYGFSILLLMEGFGVTMKVVKGRKET